MLDHRNTYHNFFIFILDFCIVSLVKLIVTGVKFIAHLAKLRCVPRRARAIARLS